MPSLAMIELIFSHTLPISDRFMSKKDIAPQRLTREIVLRTALDMLNEEGIDSITTRKLAQRLGIKSPTLYWHYKNKSLLMEAMAETIINEHHLVSLPIDGMTWQDWLLAKSVSFRRALLAYRDGARLHARTSPSQGHFNTIEAQVALLSHAGFSPVEAVALLMTLGRFIVGWVLEEQQEEIRSDPPFEADPTIYPLMLQGVNTLQNMNADDIFENGIRMVIIGAERQLDIKMQT
mgnify:FL=1